MSYMRCGVTTRISMPRSSSPQPERGSAAEPIPLFDRARPSLRPDLRAARAARAGSLKAGRRPPPEAARSGLDRREHAALIASGAPIMPLDWQQSIFETRPSGGGGIFDDIKKIPHPEEAHSAVSKDARGQSAAGAKHSCQP